MIESRDINVLSKTKYVRTKTGMIAYVILFTIDCPNVMYNAIDGPNEMLIIIVLFDGSNAFYRRIAFKTLRRYSIIDLTTYRECTMYGYVS
jgi:hypothetical protein